MAYASCSLRDTSYFAAILSQLSPMVSPVENSDMEGISGSRCESLNPLNRESQSVGFLYLWVSRSFCLNGFRYRMGRSLITSTPPATALSIWPFCIDSTADVRAAFEEIHAMEMVEAGIVPGNPDASATSLAILLVLMSCITLPK